MCDKIEYPVREMFEVKNQKVFGYGIVQSFSALFVLQKILNDNPDIKKIIELGTGEGGLTLFFGFNMASRGGRVITYDRDNPPTDGWFNYVTKYGLPIDFRNADVFSEGIKKEIGQHIQNERVLIFCDNGKKPKEIWTYAPLLKKGDLIMSHDWGFEIKEENLDPNSEHIPIKVDSIYDLCELYRQEEFDAYKTTILSLKRI